MGLNCEQETTATSGISAPCFFFHPLHIPHFLYHFNYSFSCTIYILRHAFAIKLVILMYFSSCFDSASVYFMGGFADRSSWFIECHDGAPVSFFSFKWNVNSISNSNRERLMSIVWTIDVVWNIKLSPDVSGEADPYSAQSGGHLASSVVSSRSKGCGVEYPHSYKHRRARHSCFGSRRPLWFRRDANIEVRIDCVLFFRRLPLPS